MHCVHMHIQVNFLRTSKETDERGSEYTLYHFEVAEAEAVSPSVRPSVSPSVRQSFSPSVRPSVRQSCSQSVPL